MGVPRSARSNVAALHRMGCQACPLNKAPIQTPKMAPTLSNGPIYFLAEAPGRHEDEVSHEPLTGPSGTLLRECIPDGLSHLCSFDNVVNCRPENNRTPSWIEVECCRPRRIKWVAEAKPKLIVGLGGIPLHWALGSTDLAGMRGRLFAIKVGGHSCWFMPTYHPSFILRTAWDKKRPLNSKLGHCFRMDVHRAFEVVDGLEPPHIDTEVEVRSGVEFHDGTSEGHYGRVCSLLDNARKAKTKAVDIETKGLRPFSPGAGIMSIAFSFGSINFSFGLDHPQAKWTTEQKKALREHLRGILKDDTTKIAHNSPFEIEWFIWLLGKEVVNHAAWECTQLQAHILDERRGKHQDDDSSASRYQALDFLVKQHFGFSYKSMFKVNKKDMSKSDLDETLIYNSADTKLTLRLWHHQNKLLKEQKLYDAYLEALPRQPTVALIQSIGVNVDQVEVKRAQKQLGLEIEAIDAEINDLKVIKAYRAERGVFNPHSGPDVIAVFKDYLKRPEVSIKEEKGTRYSADKHILDKIDHPLADLIVRLRNKSKLKATYVDGLELGKGEIIYPDGKVHTNFHTTFTETGRLSSSDPNLQNFPKRNDSWVRKAIIPPPDHLFVAVDYGQLEACTGAMCSLDKYLIKALWEDYDIHHEWALKIASKMPELIGGKNNLTNKPEMRKFRSLVKNKMVFPAFFGATNESVCGYLSAGTGFEVPQNLVDDIMDEFWSTFSGMGKWQEQTMKRYYEIGYVETLTGRRHNYPLTKNQAVNMPIQGTAAELVCDAMNRLSEIAVATRNWVIHPVLNVHDDLSFFIPKKQLDEMLPIIIKEMLTFPYLWVNVPLSVEVSIGKNWADVRPLDKFWSHREFGYPK